MRLYQKLIVRGNASLQSLWNVFHLAQYFICHLSHLFRSKINRGFRQLRSIFSVFRFFFKFYTCVKTVFLVFKWLFDGRKNPSFQVLLFIPIEILRQSGRHHPPLPPPGTNPTGNTQQVCQLSPVINANCSLYSIWLFDFISLILLELELATRLPLAGRARANVK